MNVTPDATAFSQLFSPQNRMATDTMKRIEDRPMVIIVGWLGCKPRHLQRYQHLYKELKFEPLVRIASPSIIMESASTSRNNVSSAMDKFSLEIVKQIHGRNPSVVLFHGFSNAGCFTWERIRTLSENDAMVESARAKIIGLIFDSGPVWYRPEVLFRAFDRCSWQDRMYVRWQWMIHSSKAMTIGRAIQYWKYMRDCSLKDDSSIFELYIYSKADMQTNFDKLHELVSHRKLVIGKGKIISRIFKSSSHCGHILIHPDEYKATIQSFISTCLQNESKSRL